MSRKQTIDFTIVLIPAQRLVCERMKVKQETNKTYPH